MKCYTPGPWAVVIPPIGADEIRSQDGYLVCELPYGAFDAPESANASLIAAAPELLEALKYVLNTCPADEDATVTFQRAVNAARAAIAKAHA